MFAGNLSPMISEDRRRRNQLDAACEILLDDPDNEYWLNMRDEAAEYLYGEEDYSDQQLYQELRRG